MTQTPVFPELGAYPGSSNVHIENGKCMPAFDHGAMPGSSDVLHYFIREALETLNPSGTPRQYAFANNVAYYFEDGARTTDQTFTAGQACQGACIVEGPPYSGLLVGTKKLIVSFGSSTSESTRYRTLTTDTSPWTAAVAGSTVTQATFWKICTLGDGSMIAITGSAQSTTNIGRCSLGEYFVAKCPRGSDPSLAASWGNVQAVGTPDWPAIELAPLRDTFCVAKGDGLYYWDDRIKRFKNALDRVKFLPHGLNGKGMTAGENGVWYPMADGRLFFFDGAVVREETPWKQGVLPRDVLSSRVSAIADRGDVVAARTECFYNTVEGPRAASALGAKIIVVRNGTATDITANCTDGSLATGGSVATLGAVAGDKIYFGSNQPFEAVVLRVTRSANAATNSFTSPQYSDGAAGWPTLGSVVDASILGTAAVSLVLTGFPPGASNSVLTWSGIQAYDLMALESVAFGGAVGTVGPLYWARFSFVTTTGFTAGTLIDEVEFVPCRGGLPNTGLLSTTTNFTHRTKAGATGRIYIGRRKGGQIIWNEEYELDDKGGVWAMAWTTSRSGTMSNGGPPILLWGRFQQTIIAESIHRDPSRALYPKLVQIGTTKPAPRLAFRKLVLGDPTKLTDLHLISVQGQYIQKTDKISCYAWWDNEDKAYELDSDYGNPATFKVSNMFPARGRELNFDLVFSDASQSDPTAPYISRVIIDHDDHGDAYAFPQDANFVTPEAI